MTQYNTLNVRLSNSQLIELKSGIKNGTEVSLNLVSNVIGDSNDRDNFPHKLLLIDTKAWRLHKAFANGLSVNIKFSKTQLSKMIQSREILTDLLAAILQVMFLIRVEALKRGVKKDVTLAQNAAPELAEKAAEYDDNKGINKPNKKCTSGKG